MKQESLLVKFIALWQVLHLSGGPVVSFLYQKWKEKGSIGSTPEMGAIN